MVCNLGHLSDLQQLQSCMSVQKQPEARQGEEDDVPKLVLQPISPSLKVHLPVCFFSGMDIRGNSPVVPEITL